MMATGNLNDPQSLPEHDAMVAAFTLKVNPVAAGVYYYRASRVAAAAGNSGLLQDIDPGIRDVVAESESDWLSSTTLDAAVALLELTGHPHILGAEAVALLKGAGCATRFALIATGPAGSRVVDAVGWDAARAAAAAGAPTERIEHLPLGTRTDETWLLVVEPVRELEPYCTFAAIRKLLAIAVSLDGYRREEKQRAALWPADALDADTDCIWASEQMSESLTTARRIARGRRCTDYETGPTGTGKEILARAIHRASPRADRPFLPVQLRRRAARDAGEPAVRLPQGLLHQRRQQTFQGVIRLGRRRDTVPRRNRRNRPPRSNRSCCASSRQLEIHPLGEPQPIKVDVRIIAATNASARTA